MIYGVIAERQVAAGGGSEPLAFADFVNDVYTIGGVSVTAADVTDHPEDIDANGIRVDEVANDTFVHLIGDFLQAIIDTSGYLTVVVEWLLDATGDPGDVMTVQKDLVPAAGYYFLNVFSTDPRTQIDVGDDDGTTFNSVTVDGLADVAAITRIAFTRRSTGISASVNGSAVETVSFAAASFVPTLSRLGGVDQTVGAGGNYVSLLGYIREVVIYDVQSDAILPTL